jgi:hypothetical protein
MEVFMVSIIGTSVLVPILVAVTVTGSLEWRSKEDWRAKLHTTAEYGFKIVVIVNVILGFFS